MEIDTARPAEWEDLIAGFDDATIHQTYAYEHVRWGARHVSHVVVRREGAVVAAAQARVMSNAITGAGMAYILNGPMWRRKGAEPDLEALDRILRALHDEYVVRRGLLLRMVPNELDEPDAPMAAAMERAGFKAVPTAKKYRTFLLDLSPSLDELKKAMHRTCRANVNKAVARVFEIEDGTDDALYEQFLQLYREMHARKDFVQFVNVDQFREVQRLLPDALKMRIRVCSLFGEPLAAAVYTTIGDTVLQLFLGTSKKALEMQAAHRLFWDEIVLFKEQGVRYFDLGGIDPDQNPGGYIFKGGFSGRDVQRVGEFEACRRLRSKLAVRLAETIRSAYRRRILGTKKAALHNVAEMEERIRQMQEKNKR